MRGLSCKHVQLIVGACIVAAFVLCGTLLPFLVGHSGLEIDLAYDLASPKVGGWLGRGENGVGIVTWLIYGARVSLFVAVLATVVSASIGITIGLLAGFVGGRVDAAVVRLIDIFLAFPGILLAIYVAAILEPRLMNVVIALCATGWVSYARLARAQAMHLKQRDFVVAAVALGASQWRILRCHILPNAVSALLIEVSFGLSTAVLAEAALSFLGLGVAPGTPSWGALLDQGVAHLFIAPHIAMASGACIALAVLGFNLLGDGLRDLWDKKDAT